MDTISLKNYRAIKKNGQGSDGAGQEKVESTMNLPWFHPVFDWIRFFLILN